VHAAHQAQGYKETAHRLNAASLKVRTEGKLLSLMKKQVHRFTLDFIILIICASPDMAPKSISTSDTARKPLLIPSLGLSGFSTSLSLLASFNSSGLKSCLNIHLATQSAMPPIG
jgi:hypothetical protein